jgi:signal transduction histidine kinase
VDKIDRIIDSVLTYNSVLKLNFREMELGSRMEEIVSQVKETMIQPSAPLIGVQVIMTDERIHVETDPDQFTIALTAILQNAVEAIDSAGDITILILRGTSPVHISNPVTALVLDTIRRSSKLLSSKRPCGMIIVTDSGSGMDDASMKNLYVPFYTTKEKGIGLGLALVRKIVDAHHGEIWIESIPGRGTAAAVIMPERSAVGSLPPYRGQNELSGSYAEKENRP